MTYVPSPRELGRLARLALDNASALLADARILLASDRAPRALALAILAAEEFGKHMMCVSATILDPGNAEAWRKFWRRFRDHEPKLTNWTGQLADIVSWDDAEGRHDEGLWEELWGSVSESVAQGLKWKMAALYVDFRDGRASSPQDVVSDEEARQAVDAVALVVDSAERLWTGADLETQLEGHAPELCELMAKLDKARTQRNSAGGSEAIHGFLSRHTPPGARLDEFVQRYRPPEAQS